MIDIMDGLQVGLLINDTNNALEIILIKLGYLTQLGH